LKQTLIDRFKYLWTWELINAFIMFAALVLIMSLNIRIGFPTLLATASVGVLLVAGAAFAYLKYRDLKAGTHRIRNYAMTLNLLRWLFPVLLAGVLGLIYAQSGFERSPEMWLWVPLYVLAVLEYINYFHVQLMYDNPGDVQHLAKHRKPKRGLIPREFGW
jgi:hypothetical protein